MSETKGQADQSYWRANILVLVLLLSVWFLVGYVLSIFFVEVLNQVHIAGFPLGFWFAQQGSIYVFIVSIYIYARLMVRLDRKHDAHEEEGDQA